MLAAAVGAVVAGGGAGLWVGAPKLRGRAEARTAGGPEVMSDLCATGRNPRDFVSATGLRMGLGLVVGVALAILAWPFAGPLGVVLAMLAPAMGWALARRELRSQAKVARRGLEEAAVSLGELVSVGIAGGLGLGYALSQGAAQLDGPQASRVGRVARCGDEPWVDVGALGRAAGVDALVDLGQVLALGSRERARTKEVLLDWAVASRQAVLADAEGRAGDMSEAMSVSAVWVLMGFLAFLLVPAVLSVLNHVQLVHP